MNLDEIRQFIAGIVAYLVTASGAFIIGLPTYVMVAAGAAASFWAQFRWLRRP